MNKKTIAIVAKFGVSVALIWFLLTKIDIDASIDRLIEAQPGLLALAFAVLLFQMLICTFRWGAVLDAVKTPLGFAKAFKLFYIGAFFNQTLPSSVGGDAVRIYKVYREGYTLGASVTGVMLERAATVIALVLVVAAMQPLFLPRVDAATAEVLLPAVVLLTAGLVGGLVLLMILDRILDRLPAAVAGWRLVRGLVGLSSDARRVFLSPARAFRALGWSVAGHVNITFGTYLIALSLGLDVTMVDCLALVPAVILVTTLPISIAGWGVREGAMVVAFGMVGVAAEGAIVLSILFGLLGIAASLPGGLIWLTGGGRAAELRAAEEETAEAGEVSAGGGGS